MMEEETTIMAALSTLTSTQLTDLTHSILTQTLHHHRRLSSLLLSPSLFSLTLHRLQSLSLPDKTLLIGKYLLSSLHHLARHFHSLTLPPHPSTTIGHRDLDAALLLLLLCDVHQEKPEMLKAPDKEWRGLLRRHLLDASLGQHGAIGVHYGGVLLPYIETVIRCWKFVGAMGGCGGKEGKEVAAAPAAVVALPTIEVRGSGVECVICKEEMREGRDVCGLPCEHLFHWKCILPWLTKRNTCPCCRFQLPTDDVYGEIERLWSTLRAQDGGALV